MGPEHEAGRLRRQAGSRQGCHSRNIAVDDYRHLIISRTQEGADHGTDVETACFSQNIDHIFSFAAGNRLIHDADLLREAFIIETAAPADHVFAGPVCQGCQDAGRGGGVSNTHFAHTEDLVTAALQRFYRFHTGIKCSQRFLSGHGRTLGQIFRAVGNPAVYDPAGNPLQAAVIAALMFCHLIVIQLFRNLHFHAHVHHQQIDAEIFGHGSHTGQTAGEIDGL